MLCTFKPHLSYNNTNEIGNTVRLSRAHRLKKYLINNKLHLNQLDSVEVRFSKKKKNRKFKSQTPNTRKPRNRTVLRPQLLHYSVRY